MDTVMEIDDAPESAPKENPMVVESEEGELSDDDGDTVLSEPLKRPEIPEIRVFCPLESEMKIQNRAGGFITGIDVFGKEEQARLAERAKRFGLDSTQVNLITEQSLKKLYHSVGVKDGDDKEFRFDSLRMHGTEAMSTQDVFEYFKDYAPTSIEWVDDESCNIVWLDNLTAIRALMGLSKPIKNITKLREQESKKEKPLTKIKVEKGEESKSDGDSDVIMIVDDEEETSKRLKKEKDEELDSDPDALDALELGLIIPEGRWRKGNTHPNSDGILLQFCPRQSKSRGNGSQRLPQPTFGMVGLMSKSRKQRIKEGLLVRPKMFHDDMGDERDFVISSDDEGGRNPWGTLAKSWSNIDRARQPPPPLDDDLFGPPLPPGFPPIMRLPPTMPLPPHSILNRVGHRRARDSHLSRGLSLRQRSRSKSASRSRSPSPVIVKSKPSVHARIRGKRQLRDDHDSEDSAFSISDSETESWTRKSKVPRMRMYADEEEVKVKERTKLQARRRLKQEDRGTNFVTEKSAPGDLRNRLGRDRTASRRGDSQCSFTRTKESDRVVRSERIKSHSHPKPKVKSVASSVWSRLSKDKHSKVNTESEDNTDTSASESEQSGTSSSSEENLRITRTLRQEESDKGSSSETDDSESEDYSDKEAVGKVDLRSKISHKHLPRNGKKRSNAPKPVAKPRSPLRIEIDNDEYYRSIQEGNK